MERQKEVSSIWYEIHITAEVNSEKEISYFRETCESIGVKSIVIDLALKNGTQRDVMTASKLFGNDFDAFEQAKAISSKLENRGFSVIRVKIESEPQHHDAPKILGDTMPDSKYFESHIPIVVKTEEERVKLKKIAQKTGARISQNPFKKTESSEILMLTLRDYKSPFLLFKKSLDKLLFLINKNNFSIHKSKLEVEFAVYDSNWLHDHHWVLGKS